MAQERKKALLTRIGAASLFRSCGMGKKGERISAGDYSGATLSEAKGSCPENKSVGAIRGVRPWASPERGQTVDWSHRAGGSKAAG